MAAPQVSPARADEFYMHRLPNGLQLLGQRMPDLESVSLCFYARTGARDEPDAALFGVSHFLEHMVFKGTARRNKRIGLWAAELFVISGVEAEVYAKSVIRADLEKPGDQDVVDKIMADFKGRGVEMSEHRLKKRMAELLATAVAQVQAEA